MTVARTGACRQSTLVKMTVAIFLTTHYLPSYSAYLPIYILYTYLPIYILYLYLSITKPIYKGRGSRREMSGNYGHGLRCQQRPQRERHQQHQQQHQWCKWL